MRSEFRDFVIPRFILDDLRDRLSSGSQILIGESLDKPPRNTDRLKNAMSHTWKYAELQSEGVTFASMWVVDYKPWRKNAKAWRAGLNIPEPRVFTCAGLIESGCLGCHIYKCEASLSPLVASASQTEPR